MWSNLPFDLLSTIFSFLSPDSLARASAACRHWHKCATLAYAAAPGPCRHKPWFLAFPTRHRGVLCYAHNPITDNWHVLSLDFVPHPVRPVAPVCGLVLFRQANTISLQLSLCNPFTRQFKRLPMLNITRTNPAVGVVEIGPSPQAATPQFRVYVAGGMSEAPRGSALYEPTLEMYDSLTDTWRIIGPMPVEFAVRLTVWTPNESVHSNGVIYWMTSARAYSVMGFEIRTNTWRELSVPMADRLEFATLVRRNGKLTLVGGGCVSDAFVWELSGDDNWSLIGKVPGELGRRFLGEKERWGSSKSKCVGIDGVVCLHMELGDGMVVWRDNVEKGSWEWIWVDGCCSIRRKEHNFPIRGVVLHPNLGASCLGPR